MATRTTRSSRSHTVIIAGSGIAGLTTAIVLRSLPSPPSITIHERRSRSEALSGPGGIMIQRNGLAALAALAQGSGEALIAALHAASYKIGLGGFQSATGDDLYLSDPKRLTGGAFDNVGISISRSALMRVLADAAGLGTPGGVDVVWESGVTGFSLVKGGSTAGRAEDVVDVMLRSAGGQETCVRGVDVLIGADGISSLVRKAVDKALARPLVPLTYGGLMWWRGSVKYASVAARCPDINRLTWSQAWLARGGSMGFFRTGEDEMAWYASAPRLADAPLEGGSALAEFLAEFGPQRASTPPVYAAIVATVEDEHREGKSIINRGPVFARPLVSSTWGTGPVTLVGDAAHAIFPSMGQGACAGMEDAADLVAFLDAAWREESESGGASVAAALRAFEKHRSPRVTRLYDESFKVYGLSFVTGTVKVWLRDTVYSMLPQWLADMQFRWLYDYKLSQVDDLKGTF